ncbi:hypothetical protein NIES4074_65400 (plasmid) [Cylindrospermum sp. NIES-4074]|nr:hypothetical protein NIES4074_65400 [Cylindrospermum sp. NIES-4074]
MGKLRRAARHNLIGRKRDSQGRPRAKEPPILDGFFPDDGKDRLPCVLVYAVHNGMARLINVNV